MNIEILFSKKRRIRNTLLTILVVICLAFSKDANCQIEFNNSDNLTATDALGRKLPGYNQVGELRKDKFVGMFYFLWQTRNADNHPNNIPEILSKDPKAIDDYRNSIWPNPKTNPWYWWSEPLFGYYRNTDEWVLRKHAEMLADANVDVVIFDCSNGDTWEEAYPVLCKVFLQARKDGVKAPQIAFLLPFGPGENGRKEKIKLYNELYKPGLYKDLWFYWKGKPLILSYPDDLTDDPDNPAISKLYGEIRNFFTFRPSQPVYDRGPNRPDQWGWLQIFPQHGFVNNNNGTFEQVTVGVSQNWSKERGVGAMSAPGNFGRSYTNKTGHTTDSNAINYGLNFQEQWDRALQLDPEFIFVTSWNEWLVGRIKLWQQQTNAFADAFNQENSRDIEPMKGGHLDNYYYQLVSNIRRFKGMRPPLKPSSKTTIKIDGEFAKWDNVMPIFTSYKNNTEPRYSPGWKNYFYKNNSGRNDIISAKIARNDKFVYFYVETFKNLSPKTDSGWMRLFIDADRNKTTGWEGYDFVINRVHPGKQAILEKSIGGWNWVQVGTINYAVKGNKLEIEVPKSMLNISGELDLEFKWSDNMKNEGDIIDFLINGDVAPGGRFNFHYSSRDTSQKYISYPTVKISDQVWMAENLNVNTFRNGDTIPEARSILEWERFADSGKPAWCYYDAVSNANSRLGKLYNWYAVTDPRGLAPKGWHVPSTSEWNELINNLGGMPKAGEKMQTINVWKERDDNNDGFSAVPAGFRGVNGTFYYRGEAAYWWTSDSDNIKESKFYTLDFNNNSLYYSFSGKRNGMSIRCIKD